MIIPLSDSIWTRLYGPYGIEDVANSLAKLESNWEPALARELYWEKLHHQGDLYPITFAALPWLWKIADCTATSGIDNLAFFSHVLYCAMQSGGTGSRGDGPRGRYRGLSTDVQHHQWSWIPEERRLLVEDMNVLHQLEDWFSQTAPKIAGTCISAVSGDDNAVDADLVAGFLTLHGGENITYATELWASGEELSLIFDEIEISPADVSASKTLLTLIEGRNSALENFLDRTSQLP